MSNVPFPEVYSTSSKPAATKPVKPVRPDPSNVTLEEELTQQDEAYWMKRCKMAEGKYQKLLEQESVTRRLTADIKELAPKSYSPAPSVTVGRSPGKDSPVSALLIFSDTHIGKTVTPEQTLDFGEYNIKVFLDRLQHLQDSMLHVLDEKDRHNHIEEVVVAMLGDMLDGGLNHGNEIDQEVSKFSQYYTGGHAIAQFFRALAARFPKVRIETCVGNHCVDAETEILTKRGWLKYDEVRAGDQCLGLNKDGSTSVWQPVNEVVIEKQVDNMVTIKNREFNFRGTEHHRFYYKIPGHPMLNEARWSEIKSLPISIPAAAQVKNVETKPVPDDKIELCAWVLTDGGIYSNGNRVTVYQSKEDNLEIIRQAFTKAGYAVIDNTRDRERPASIGGVPIRPGMYTEHAFSLSAEDSRHFLNSTGLVKGDLPEWVWSMNKAQVDRFINTLILGDGTRRGDCATLYGKSKEWLGKVQALAVSNNIRATISEYQAQGSNQWRLILVFDTTYRTVGESASIDYSEATGETVWCVRTDTENFMCRRNGVSYFTGNTRWDGQKRMPTKYRYSNLDMFLYAYVQSLTADIKNIEWNLNMQPFQRFTVQGSTFFAAHGDHLRGGDKALGIPSHALSRQLSNISQLLDKQDISNPDYYLYGHFHRAMQLPHSRGKIFVNGAFPGVDEYALTNNFLMSDPEQTLMIIHPKYRAADNWPIQLKHAVPGASRYVIPSYFE